MHMWRDSTTFVWPMMLASWAPLRLGFVPADVDFHCVGAQLLADLLHGTTLTIVKFDRGIFIATKLANSVINHFLASLRAGSWHLHVDNILGLFQIEELLSINLTLIGALITKLKQGFSLWSKWACDKLSLQSHACLQPFAWHATLGAMVPGKGHLALIESREMLVLLP